MKFVMIARSFFLLTIFAMPGLPHSVQAQAVSSVAPLAPGLDGGQADQTGQSAGGQGGGQTGNGQIGTQASGQNQGFSAQLRGRVGEGVLDPSAQSGAANQGLVTGSLRGRRAAARDQAIRRDPYAPLGIRAGRFVWYPSLDLLTGYATNRDGAYGGKGDGFFQITPELRFESDFARHALSGTLSVTYTDYFKGSDADVLQGTADVTGRLDLVDRTTLTLRGTYQLAQEPRSSDGVPGTATKRPVTHTLSGTAALERRIGQMQLRLSGGIERSLYGDVSTGAGAVSNDDRDATTYRVALRAGVNPGQMFSPFMEVEKRWSLYDKRLDRNNLQRGSTVLALRGGVSINQGSKLSGEVSVGIERFSPHDSRLSRENILTMAANLNWSPTALTTFELAASTTFRPTTLNLSSGSTVRTISVTANHRLRRNVTLSGNLGYTHEVYSGISQRSQQYNAGLGVTYQLNRSFAIRGLYDFTYLDSNQPVSDYKTHQFRAGIKWQH